MSNSNQVFQTNNASRWFRIKWTTRIILSILLFFISIVIIAIITGKAPSLPIIDTKDTFYKTGDDPLKSLAVKNNLTSKYKGFKFFLEEKDKQDSINNINKTTIRITTDIIRAVFYSPASNYAVALNDLKTNATNFNTIFPEWFFFDANNNLKIQSRIDSAGLAIMRQNHLKIMPMLTNFNSAKGDFDGSLLHNMLNDSTLTNLFVNNLKDTLLLYKFDGINIDFEELKEKNNVALNNFQKKLYTVFHNNGLTVTQDVIPMNDDYDFEKLQAYNDYIILMAYDQHNDWQTGPGPIAAQKWIEEVLDKAANKMQSNKIIVGLAGYGYDWSYDEDGKPYKEDGIIVPPKDVSYNEAIDNAKLINATVLFDNDNFNFHYNYTEKKGDETISHVVWFIGAPTTYNTLRFADEYGTGGTALWVLGKEDKRIWNFYNRSLTNDALAKNPFNYNSFTNLPLDASQKPTPKGEGELLQILFTPQNGKATVEIDTAEQLITEHNFTQLPSGYVYQKFGEDTTSIGKGHKIILTFDDGPSSEFTPPILNILEREKVPATFFIVGLNAENNIPILQRIYKDGFEIGNHTFTHNNIAKMSPQRADLEMKSTRLLIEAVTGRSTILFRAPYNADSEPQTYEEIEPIARSKKDNYITIGESIDPQDWDDEHINADTIFNRVVALAEATKGNIILLHDAGGNTRQATIDALPRIIQYFRNKGCEFTTVANLMGKTKNDVMPPVSQGVRGKFNYYFSVFFYWTSQIIFALFLVGIFLSISRMFILGILAYKQNNKEKKLPIQTEQPGVSIIVPAYNEEINAIRTVKSLLQQDYPTLQIVFVDDGSKDSTFEKVSQYFKEITNVEVVTKQNGGKATALNYGINMAKYDFVVCIDADTQLRNDAVTELMKKFYDSPNTAPVGAVAGNVKVGNEINMITKWQSIEYTTSQNFDRSAFDYLNCITVVPGAIGAFKKEAVIQAGGFTMDTLAEDCDLTMRLHKLGYSIKNCRQAISYTEAPETFTQFLKQRFRWSFGVLQSFWKHRDAFLNPRYKNFGMFAMPNILIFQIILPFLAPLADFILIISLIAAAFGIIPASTGHIVLYYFIFTIVVMLGAAIAFSFENTALKNMQTQAGQRQRESYKKLLWLFPQQLMYRQLMYYILIKSISKALKGELQGWGVLKRTGNVTLAK